MVTVIHRNAGVLMLLATMALAAPLAAQPIEGFPANSGFEDDLRGWTVLAPDGAAAAEPAGGVVGELALSLHGGWVISAPGDAAASGWVAVSLRARPTAGADQASRLAIALTVGQAEPQAVAALTAEAFGGEWRPVRVELLAPPDPPVRIALGVDGADPWLIDAIEVERITPRPPDDHEPPVIPDDLEPGWEPEGVLDAYERTIGDARELLVGVAGLEIGIPAVAEAPRGERGALRVTAANRGMGEKELTVSVAGPPGSFVPERTVSIRAGGTTIFTASLQSLLVGEAWVRVTFRCEGEEGSAPVRVTTSPAYPAAGVVWLDGPPTREELAAVAPLDAQLYAVRVPTDEAATADLALPDAVTRLILLGAPWSEDAVRGAARGLAGVADALAVHSLRGEASPDDPDALTSALGAFPDGLVLGPPLDLQAGSPPSLPDDALELACRLGERRAIAAPSLRLPVLHTGVVGAVTVGREASRTTQPCWPALASAVRLDDVAAAIRARARLPLFFPEVTTAPTGSPEVDALVMARVLAACVYQGATGFTLPARLRDCPPGATGLSLLDAEGAPREVVAQAFAELARELAGAVPLRVYAQTDEIGLADDALVGFRPFMRGDEGLLALWNNTGADLDLIFEMRTQPLDVHTVEIGADGVRRDYVGAFHYSDDAVALNRPVVFVSLRPGQFKLLSMQLARPHAGWLASVEFAPEIPTERRGPRDFVDEWEKRRIDP